MLDTEEIYNSASRFIINNKLYDYPINLKQICKDNGWKVKYYDNKYKELYNISEDAFVVYNEKINNYIIFLNKSQIIERKRFSIAHEIGHIVLNHHSKENGDIIAHSSSNTKIEQEANMFARLLLCPSQIINHIPKNTTCISKLFKVSNQMASLTLKYFYKDLYNMKDIPDICYEQSIEKFIKTINPNCDFTMWND